MNKNVYLWDVAILTNQYIEYGMNVYLWVDERTLFPSKVANVSVTEEEKLSIICIEGEEFELPIRKEGMFQTEYDKTTREEIKKLEESIQNFLEEKRAMTYDGTVLFMENWSLYMWRTYHRGNKFIGTITNIERKNGKTYLSLVDADKEGETFATVFTPLSKCSVVCCIDHENYELRSYRRDGC